MKFTISLLIALYTTGLFCLFCWLNRFDFTTRGPRTAPVAFGGLIILHATFLLTWLHLPARKIPQK